MVFCNKKFGWFSTFNLCLILFAAFILVSCGVKLPVYISPGPTPVPSYNFNYQPPGGLPKLKESYTFLMLQPKEEFYQPYSKGELKIQVSSNASLPRLSNESADDINRIISSFRYSLKEDFKELLTARGFRLIGEAETQDAITFNQRELSIFSIQPVVRIELDDTIDKDIIFPRQPKAFGNWEPGEVNGKLIVKARVSIEVKEPLTWQLLWTKSVESQTYSEKYSFRWNYSEKSPGFPVVGEDTRPQILANILGKLYNDVMNKFESYIDPNEFTLLNKQAQEIRKKAEQVIK